jgi:CIC family chloride channel protein
LEEIMGDLHATVLGTAVLSSATSWMVLHLLLGDDPLFHVSGYSLTSNWEFAIYAILGVVGGLGSVAFVKLLLWLRLKFAELPKHTVWFQPVAGGLTVGLIGFFVPDVMGVGYNYVERVLNGDVVLRTVVMLGLLKIFATAMCYSSGNAGGIFGPSLFIGAMMGASVGAVAHYFFPALTADPGAYALVGMGTAFAGIVRTPLTSVIMIFEVTRDYSIIVPLMISNLIAYLISYKLQREPIYEALAHQDGVHLPSAEVRGVGSNRRVAQVVKPARKLLAPDMSVADALEQVSGETFDVFPVVGSKGLFGMVRLDTLTEAAAASSGQKLSELLKADLTAEPTAEHFPHIHLDHSLHLALERMGSSDLSILPVVSRENVRKLLGIVVLADVLKAYGVAKADGEVQNQNG